MAPAPSVQYSALPASSSLSFPLRPLDATRPSSNLEHSTSTGETTGDETEYEEHAASSGRRALLGGKEEDLEALDEEDEELERELRLTGPKRRGCSEHLPVSYVCSRCSARHR